MNGPGPHPYLTTFLLIWGFIGPLAGIAFAHLLSKNWQREQWRLDNIKTETRELLALFNALVPAYTAWARQTRQGPVLLPGQSQEDVDRLLAQYTDRSVAFHSALRDRLFIYANVRGLNLDKLWAKAMKAFEETHSERTLLQVVEDINAIIVNIAMQKRVH